jgi:hypothetical protein
MFASKAEAYPNGVPLLGRFLALPAKIRQGWKGLLETNTLAYFVKSFISSGLGHEHLSKKPILNF